MGIVLRIPQILDFRTKDAEIREVVQKAVRNEKVKTWLKVSDLVKFAATAWENASPSTSREVEEYQRVVVDRVARASDSVHGYVNANLDRSIHVWTLEHRRKCVLTETIVGDNFVQCKDGVVSFPSLMSSDRVEYDICTMIEYV